MTSAQALPRLVPGALVRWAPVAQAAGLAIALLAALALGAGAARAPAVDGYAARAGTLLAVGERSVLEGDQLLTERDADPGLSQDPAWLARHAGVVAALDAEYRAALTLPAPPSAAPLQTCLSEGLRLVATGHDLLQRAYLTDGHGAYYDSAHGNWDLQLGQQRLQTCRGLLLSA